MHTKLNNIKCTQIYIRFRVSDTKLHLNNTKNTQIVHFCNLFKISCISLPFNAILTLFSGIQRAGWCCSLAALPYLWRSKEGERGTEKKCPKGGGSEAVGGSAQGERSEGKV